MCWQACDFPLTLGAMQECRIAAEKLACRRGDRVLFSKYAGTEVQVEGDEHIIIREDDVLGVVEK